MKKTVKRALSLIIAGVMTAGIASACGSKKAEENAGTPTNAPAAATNAPAPDAPANNNTDTAAAEPTEATTPAPGKYADIGLGDDLRFTETRKITVEVFDRGLDNGRSKPEDNFYTKWIQEGMLRDHNVEVTFVPVPRWTETDDISNLLAAGSAPDVCLTYSYPTIQSYATAGGVTDLGEYVDKYADIIPNLWDLLGDNNINYDRDPNTNQLWAIEARLARNPRTNTFVREDWLNKLGLSYPTTLAEFEALLVAFKDNAAELLGDEADKLIPFSISFDIGWRAEHLTTAFIPNNTTDKDFYVNGFDDRNLLQTGYKEGIRVLNDWYNKGLIWKDFYLYGEGDTTEENLIKSGYVGALIFNWEYPYRDGESGVTGSLHTLVGPDANYITVEPFPNDAGIYRKILSNPVDRKVFMPATNNEPIASLLYLDWITKFENRKFLQIGEEGVTHEVFADGAIQTIAASGDKIMNSPQNIDYTMTLNGLLLETQEATMKAVALGYPGTDAKYVTRAYETSTNEGFVPKHVNLGMVQSEEGMANPLKEKRDTFLGLSVIAAPGKFDSVFDSGMADYLGSGGQAIIDEHRQKWEAQYGDAVNID